MDDFRNKNPNATIDYSCEREMTADEFGEWLNENLKATDQWLHREHGGTTLYKVLETMTASEVVTEVEKAKLPTAKEINTCRIIEECEGGLKKCVYELDMLDEVTQRIGTKACMKNILIDYASQHEGNFFAVLSQRLVAVKGISN